MKILIEGPADGPTNMARDIELLSEAEWGVAAARLYGWDGPWVSLGRFQNPGLDLKPGCPVPYVMRPTGGYGVLHGHDVTIGAAWPLGSFRAGGFRDLRSVYRACVAPIIGAMRCCNVRAVLGEQMLDEPNRRIVGDCFLTASKNDLIDSESGQKVCGCALKVTRNGVLLQASIPIEEPWVRPSSIFQEVATVRTLPVDRRRLIAELGSFLSAHSS